jgi:hypothetical protein
LCSFINFSDGLLGEDTASYPGLLSLLIVVLVPGADFFLRSLLDRFFPAEETEGLRKNMNASPVIKRAARILLVILALFLLGRVWDVNFFVLGEESFGEELMRAIVNIALTLLVADVAWGVIKAALARYLPGQEEQASRRSPHKPPAIPGISLPPHWICG